MTTKTTSTHSLKRYFIAGDFESHPFEYWAGAFGTGKAHQLVDSQVLLEEIDDSDFESGWTGEAMDYEIDLAKRIFERKS